jgi:hypothetical protein
MARKVCIGQNNFIAVAHLVEGGKQFGAQQWGYANKHLKSPGLFFAKMRIGCMGRFESIVHAHELLLSFGQTVEPFGGKSVVRIDLASRNVYWANPRLISGWLRWSSSVSISSLSSTHTLSDSLDSSQEYTVSGLLFFNLKHIN